MKGLNGRYLTIVLGCSLFVSVLKVPFNCTGLIFAAILEESDFFTLSTQSLFWTTRMLANGLMAPFMTRMYLKSNYKFYLLLIGALNMMCYIPMVFYNRSWMWIVSAILLGTSGAGEVMVVAATINRWFKDGSGTMLGICNASANLATAILSPLISSFIISLGWRTSTIGMALGTFTCVLVCAVVLLKKEPANVGMFPYEKKDTENVKIKSVLSNRDAIKTKNTLIIYTIILTVILISCVVNMVFNYLPSYASSLGYMLTVGAMLTSVSSLVGLIAKLVAGVFCDKFGAWKAIALIYGVICFSFVAVLALNSSVLGLAIVSAGTGISHCMFAILLPKLSQASFGENYEIAYGRLNLLVNVIGTVFLYLVGKIVDSPFGIPMVFKCMIGLCVVSLLMVVWVYFINKKAEKIIYN